MTKLSLNEIPPVPLNTPERADRNEGIDASSNAEMPAGRRRSLTEPTAVRDFAVVKGRDSANVGAVAV